MNILKYTTLVRARDVIPPKAGIQENTGFPRIKYGAGLVKPGMTKYKRRSVPPSIKKERSI